jgi:outer membrane protein OmpA-like peptidoglycan-associated protein
MSDGRQQQENDSQKLENERIERERERHEWEKERNQREEERFVLDKHYRKKEQSQTWLFRYVTFSLQLITLAVVFGYPMIHRQDGLENRIKETISASIKDEIGKNIACKDQSLRARLENQIKETISASINDEFNKRFASSFTVGQFKVVGPSGSTPDSLVGALFKTAAERGSKSLDDALKTAIDAVELGDKGFSLLVKVTEKTSDLVHYLWPSVKIDPPPPPPSVKIDPPLPPPPPAVIPDQVTFNNDRFDLTEAAKTSLDKVAEYLTSERGKSDKVLVEGHASTAGKAQHNLQLSWNRARQVTRYLVEHGVMEERITQYGFGQGYQWLPFESNNIAENRRVRIATCGEEIGSDRCVPKKDSALVAQHQQLGASE